MQKEQEEFSNWLEGARSSYAKTEWYACFVAMAEQSDDSNEVLTVLRLAKKAMKTETGFSYFVSYVEDYINQILSRLSEQEHQEAQANMAIPIVFDVDDDPTC